jgi:hypothetical protein
MSDHHLDCLKHVVNRFRRTGVRSASVDGRGQYLLNLDRSGARLSSTTGSVLALCDGDSVVYGKNGVARSCGVAGLTGNDVTATCTARRLRDVMGTVKRSVCVNPAGVL